MRHYLMKKLEEESATLGRSQRIETVYGDTVYGDLSISTFFAQLTKNMECIETIASPPVRYAVLSNQEKTLGLAGSTRRVLASRIANDITGSSKDITKKEFRSPGTRWTDNST